MTTRMGHEGDDNGGGNEARQENAHTDATTPQPGMGEKQGREARTRRRGEPRKGSRQHRRKCP